MNFSPEITDIFFPQSIVAADNYYAGLETLLEDLHHTETAEPLLAAAADSSDSGSNRTSSLFGASGFSHYATDRNILLMKCTSNAVLQSLTTCYSILHKYKQSTRPQLPPGNDENNPFQIPVESG